MDVQNNEELFEQLMQKFIYFLDHVKDESYLVLKFVEPVMFDCLNKAMGVWVKADGIIFETSHH